ncbi:MAG: hypothetical protein RLZZ58_1715 [Pseudomonadota bacterium]
MPRCPRHMIVALAATMLLGAAKPAMDPVNPTCPKSPGWATNPQMSFTPLTVNGLKIVYAEGRIDAAMPDRLKAFIAEQDDIDEFWISSPGGDARAGNMAGRLLRDSMDVTTRIPTGWACYSACNFLFMAGRTRYIDKGGQFIVHMFTRTGDRDAIDMSVAMGTDATTELIGEIEQDAAMLASEDNDFLIRMGLSRKLLTDIMYRQKAVAGASADRSTRRCLTRAEALEYGVVSE